MRRRRRDIRTRSSRGWSGRGARGAAGAAEAGAGAAARACIGLLVDLGLKKENILVTDGDRSGKFRPDGSWIEGEIRECDPQLCNWVAGPLVANHRVGKAADQDTHRQER